MNVDQIVEIRRVFGAIAREFGPELAYDDFLEKPSSAGLSDRVLAEAA